MSEKLDLIYDLLKSDREEASDFRKEVRESHRDTGERLGKLEHNSQVQNSQLQEHMRRTEILEDLHVSNEGKIGVNSHRIEKLEEPRKVIGVLKKWVLGVGGVAGAAVAIARLLGLF